MTPAEVLAKIEAVGRTDSSVHVPAAVRLVSPRRPRRAERGRLASAEGGVLRMPGVAPVPLASVSQSRGRADARTRKYVANLLSLYQGDVEQTARALHQSHRLPTLDQCRRLVLKVRESTK